MSDPSSFNDDTRPVPYVQTPESQIVGPPIPTYPQEPPKKKKRTGVIVAIVLIVLAVIVAGCVGVTSLLSDTGKKGLDDGLKAGTSQSASPSASATSEVPKDIEVKMGQPLIDKRDGFQATYVLSKPEQKTTDEFQLKPKRGVFFVVYMQASVSEGSDYICSCNLQFVGPDGTVYEENFSTFAGKPGINANDVGKGQKISGWTSFDVPKNAVKGGKIQLKPNMFEGDRVGYWIL